MANCRKENGYQVSIFSIRLDTKYPPDTRVNRINTYNGTSVENKEREPGVESGCEDGKLIRINQYSHKHKEYST